MSIAGFNAVFVGTVFVWEN